MPSLMRCVPAGILAVLIAATAAACGSSGPARPGDSGKSATSAPAEPLAGLTADQIAQKALKDLAAASSVRISGNVPSQDGDITLDISDVAPASCEGNFVVPLSVASPGASGTAKVAIIKVGGAVYLKPSKSYLESLHAPAAIFAELNGKYIKSTSSSALADIAKACNLSTLVGGFTQSDTGFVKSGTATVDGQPALVLTQPGFTPQGTIDISDSATPEILRIAESANTGIFLDFSNFNARVAIAAPPADDIYYGPKSLD